MLLVLEPYTKVSVHNAFNNIGIELIMPSHLGGQAPEVSTEMPPPLFTPEVITQAPLVDQFGVMLIIGTIIVAGIFVFIVLRRTRKK